MQKVKHYTDTEL